MRFLLGSWRSLGPPDLSEDGFANLVYILVDVVNQGGMGVFSKEVPAQFEPVKIFGLVISLVITQSLLLEEALIRLLGDPRVGIVLKDGLKHRSHLPKGRHFEKVARRLRESLG